MKKILTPIQQAEEEKLKAQQTAVGQIQKILEENNLVLIVEHLIKVIPKR